jgi:hypothetical protein
MVKFWSAFRQNSSRALTGFLQLRQLRNIYYFIGFKIITRHIKAAWRWVEVHPAQGQTLAEARWRGLSQGFFFCLNCDFFDYCDWCMISLSEL